MQVDQFHQIENNNMMLIHVNAKGFFFPDGQRPSKRDLLDLQCVRGRQYEHSGVCALLEQVDKKGGFLLNNYRLLRLELCQIVRPKSAIIIVDVQNDFISGDCEKLDIYILIDLNIK